MPRNRAPSPQTMKVLGALAADPSRWRHGYELGAETGLKAGSLYPILVRLADRKLLEARWEESPPPGRPARHLYRLTPGGQELAAAAPGASAPAALPAPAAPARAARGRHGMPQPGGA
jgi:PadR family transcriptional regulator PadR